MRLLIVDDDTLILKSLSLALAGEADITIVGCATNGIDALTLCAALASAPANSPNQMPDIILMDIRMPGVDGIAATRLLKERYPQVRIMMLTTFDDRSNIQQALTAGADGYLIKTDKIADIAGKLRIMMDGTGVLGAAVLKKLTMTMAMTKTTTTTKTTTMTKPKNPLLDTLTPREKDIAQLVAQGLTNKQIAGQLFLSEGTIRNKIVVIMEKLNVSNRTQLGRVYYDSEHRPFN